MPKPTQTIRTVRTTVSTITIVRVLFIILLFGLGLGFIYLARGPLLLIGVSFFLAMALNPAVSWLARKITRGSRGLATGLAYLIVLTGVGLLLYLLVPPLVDQTQKLIEQTPEFVEDLQTEDSPVARFVRKYELTDEIANAKDEISSKVLRVRGPLVSVATRVFSSIASVITVLVLTFFMLVEGQQWLNRFWQLHPRPKQKHRQQLAHKMYRTVTGYVNGQLILASVSSVLAYIIFRILGLPFALPLASLIWLFGLIPMIGNILGATVAIIVGLFHSFGVALFLLVYFLIYQQVENATLQPYVHSKTVNVSPLMVLVAALIGGTLGGIFGAFIALPIAASIRILLNDYIERHHLRDHGISLSKD